jgi:hypothetical protein
MKNSYIYDYEVDEKNLLDHKYFQLKKNNNMLLNEDYNHLNKTEIDEITNILKKIKFSTEELDLNFNEKLNILKYYKYLSNIFDETKVKIFFNNNNNNN